MSLLTIFSPSPIHLLVRLLALMLKKAALMFEATALPIRVLPVPGGPNSKMPFGGARGPGEGTSNMGMWSKNMPQLPVSEIPNKEKQWITGGQGFPSGT